MGTSAKHVAILSVVQTIPRGHVMTYGQVARAAGLPRHARLVGRVLRDLPSGSDVPWHRVVSAGGTISERVDGGAVRQRRLLENEGITFDERGRIDLGVHEYIPKRIRRRLARARRKPA